MTKNVLTGYGNEKKKSWETLVQDKEQQSAALRLDTVTSGTE
jgi:hypothetical protein